MASSTTSSSAFAKRLGCSKLMAMSTSQTKTCSARPPSHRICTAEEWNSGYLQDVEPAGQRLGGHAFARVARRGLICNPQQHHHQTCNRVHKERQVCCLPGHLCLPHSTGLAAGQRPPGSSHLDNQPSFVKGPAVINTHPPWVGYSLMVGIRSPDGLVVGLAPATLEFGFPTERNHGKQGVTLC
jgi:hypothetical protein